MKKLFLALSLLMVGSLGIAASTHFWRGTVLKETQVKEKWGAEPFLEKNFKNGSMSQRAKMAYSLLQMKKEFKGLSVPNLRKKLGSPDGYYFSDTIPAYMIAQAQKKGEDSWQIVFMIDKDRKVKDIFVHKNCCD